jgi:hypothetical protein
MDSSLPGQRTSQQTKPSDTDSISTIENPSYRRPQPLVLTDRIRRVIAGAIAEIDLEQMRILRILTPAQRVQQAVSLMDAAERAGAFRLRGREPELSEEEALRIVRGGLLNYRLRKRKP